MSQPPDALKLPAAPRGRKSRKLRMLLLVGGLAACVWFVRQAGDVLVGLNFHAVLPGGLYRGAQASPRNLESLAKDYGVRTIVNLRGQSVHTDWYRNQCRAAERLSLHVEDVGFNATRLPSAVELRRLIEVLDRAEYPIYLHCRRGADRTGLGSVVVMLLQPESTVEEARQQLHVRYGHVPIGRSTILDRFFDLYEAWLANEGRGHEPSTFRHWALDEYERLRGRGPVESVIPLHEKARVGEPLGFRVHVKNSGTQPWRFRPGRFCGIHVGYQVYDLHNRLIAEGRGGMMERLVKPGDDLQVTLVAAPFKRPGTYRMLIDLVEERHCWFFQTGGEPWEQELIVRE